MPSLTCFNFRFTPSWLMIVLAASFISLFSYLGFWQMHRADEKAKMISAEKALAKKAPINWQADEKFPKQYQQVKVEGQYLNTLFFLDNQHYKHQFGYEVVSPLLLNNNSVVLIDRGWVPAIGARQLPTIIKPKGLMHITGSVYFPSKNSWILGPSHEKKAPELFIIESIETKMLSHLLQKKVYPFIIRLDKKQAYGFMREWAIVSMPPERHLGYAVQWFAMAFVLIILFVALNLKKN